MRKKLLLLLVLSCLLGMIGCRQQESEIPNTPNAMVPSIVYEGNLYRTTGKEIPTAVDESAIVGEITSVVPLTELPVKEGEANFGEVGDPYAITSDGLLVIMNQEWVLFEMNDQ